MKAAERPNRDDVEEALAMIATFLNFSLTNIAQYGSVDGITFGDVQKARLALRDVVGDVVEVLNNALPSEVSG